MLVQASNRRHTYWTEWHVIGDFADPGRAQKETRVSSRCNACIHVDKGPIRMGQSGGRTINMVGIVIPTPSGSNF